MPGKDTAIDYGRSGACYFFYLFTRGFFVISTVCELASWPQKKGSLHRPRAPAAAAPDTTGWLCLTSVVVEHARCVNITRYVGGSLYNIPARAHQEPHRPSASCLVHCRQLCIESGVH